MPILNWEYKGVDVIQLARNKSMPEVIKVKNMDGVVCRYIPERECHDTGESRWFCCSNCGCGINDIYLNDEGKYGVDARLCGCDDEFPYYCPYCGAKVVKQTTSESCRGTKGDTVKHILIGMMEQAMEDIMGPSYLDWSSFVEPYAVALRNLKEWENTDG